MTNRRTSFHFLVPVTVLVVLWHQRKVFNCTPPQTDSETEWEIIIVEAHFRVFVYFKQNNQAITSYMSFKLYCGYYLCFLGQRLSAPLFAFYFPLQIIRRRWGSQQPDKFYIFSIDLLYQISLRPTLWGFEYRFVYWLMSRLHGANFFALDLKAYAHRLDYWLSYWLHVANLFPPDLWGFKHEFCYWLICYTRMINLSPPDLCGFEHRFCHSTTCSQ